MVALASITFAMIRPTSHRRVEIAGALAAALGERADEVLVAIANNVRLDIPDAMPN